MAVMGLDTAGDVCSVALIDPKAGDGHAHPGGKVLYSSITPMRRGHAEALAPAISDAFTACDLTPADIALIGVGRGPGAFTGLRIALAAAAGLSVATGVPIAGVCNLTVAARMAAQNADHTEAQWPKPILVCLESRRDDIFAQAFMAHESHRIESLGTAAAIPPTDLGTLLSDGVGHPMNRRILLAGNAAKRALAAMQNGESSSAYRYTFVPSPVTHADPAVIAAMAWEIRDTARLDPPPPAYLREPDAKPMVQGRGIFDSQSTG